MVIGVPGQGGAELEGRAGRVWKLYAVKRWTQERIAKELGVSQQMVSRILADVRAALPAVDKAAMIQKSIELHEHIIAEMHALAEMEGAPVTSGKDGDVVRDPDSDAIVRDYGGRLAALRLAMNAEEQLRKLTGIDAASKVESTAHVRYELIGVDPDDLA